MSYSPSGSAHTTVHSANHFDSNTFLNPEPMAMGGDGGQTPPFLQHSLLTFFSEFDTIITRELRRPAASLRH